MDVSNMKRLKELEEENARLKKMDAEEKLKVEFIEYECNYLFWHVELREEIAEGLLTR